MQRYRGRHIFQLGTKYSEAMKATFINQSGKPSPMIMGCYGIGVSRIIAAAIEQIMMTKVLFSPSLWRPLKSLSHQLVR